MDYISQFVELEEKHGEWWGISPFTDPPEKTPSFSVRREEKSFYDFSSGIGGNTFTFVRYYNQCDAKRAVELMRQYVGDEGGETSAPAEKLSAAKTCRKFAPPVQRKKTAAGVVLPADQMERYELRQDKLKLWLDEGISMESLIRFNVRYDPFSNCLVYPIYNLGGVIVNVGGRTTDPDFKEKGLRKYTYFYNWGTLDVVYGLFDNLDAINEQKEVILFEGCKSVLLADTWGIRNCGALLTSHLNERQMKILARLGCRVVFALDQEIDVRKDRQIQRLKNYINVEYLYDRAGLLSPKDAPVDKGREVFQRLYDERVVFR